FVLMSWRPVRNAPSLVWQRGWKGYKQMLFEKFPEGLELGMLGEIPLNVHQGARDRRGIPPAAFYHGLIRKGPQGLEVALQTHIVEHLQEGDAVDGVPLRSGLPLEVIREELFSYLAVEHDIRIVQEGSKVIVAGSEASILKIDHAQTSCLEHKVTAVVIAM